MIFNTKILKYSFIKCSATQTSVTLTQFAVAEAFLLHLAPEGPDPSQFGLLVVCVLSELLQSLLFGHLLLLLLLLPLILQLQVPQPLLLQQPTNTHSQSGHTGVSAQFHKVSKALQVVLAPRGQSGQC